MIVNNNKKVPSSRNDQTYCELENSLLFVLYLYCLGKRTKLLNTSLLAMFVVILALGAKLRTTL